MTFREFLEQHAHETHPRERRERREEWIQAVGRLTEQMRGWLAESDPTGILDVLPIEVERAEPSLGAYRIPGLSINLGDAKVQVAPVGRNSVGRVAPPGEAELRADGRVDVTDGMRNYILYRILKEGQEKWYVLDGRFQAAPLDRPHFEKALQDLLS